MYPVVMMIGFFVGGLMGFSEFTVAQTESSSPEIVCETTEDPALALSPFATELQTIETLICQNQWQEATALLHQIVLAGSEDNSCSLCSLYLPLGEILAQNQAWEEAINAYKFALNGSILDGSEYDALGFYLVEYDQLEAALIAFQQLGSHLGHEDNRAFAYTRLGDALSSAERWDEAQSAYETALTLDSGEPFAYQGLGLIFMAKEQWAEAIAAFEKTLELHPTLTETQQYLREAQQQLNKKSSPMEGL